MGVFSIGAALAFKNTYHNANADSAAAAADIGPACTQIARYASDLFPPDKDLVTIRGGKSEEKGQGKTGIAQELKP